MILPRILGRVRRTSEAYIAVVDAAHTPCLKYRSFLLHTDCNFPTLLVYWSLWNHVSVEICGIGMAENFAPFKLDLKEVAIHILHAAQIFV